MTARKESEAVFGDLLVSLLDDFQLRSTHRSPQRISPTPLTLPRCLPSSPVSLGLLSKRAHFSLRF